jgi:hypothetical protein
MSENCFLYLAESNVWEGSPILGIRWVVGNGSTIQITKDKWIPDTPAYLVNPMVPLSDGQTVDTLINSESRSWNEVQLSEVFHKQIVHKILTVPSYQLTR